MRGTAVLLFEVLLVVIASTRCHAKTSLTASVYASSNVPSYLRKSPTLDPTFSFLVVLTPSAVSASPASEASNVLSKPRGSNPLRGRDPATYATIARA